MPDVAAIPVDLILYALLLCLRQCLLIYANEQIDEIEVEAPLLDRTARELVHIEDIIHEGHEVLERLPLPRPDLRQHLDVLWILLREVHETDDAVQWGSEVVAHVRQEAGLHFTFPLRRIRLIDEVELPSLHITDASHRTEHVGDTSRLIPLLHEEGQAMPAAVDHLILGVEDVVVRHPLRDARKVHKCLHCRTVLRCHQYVAYLPKPCRRRLFGLRDVLRTASIADLLCAILEEVDPHDGRVGLRNRRDDLIAKLRLIERRLQLLLYRLFPLHDAVDAAEADQRTHLALCVIRPHDLRLEVAVPVRCRHALIVSGHTRLLRQQLPDIRHTEP